MANMKGNLQHLYLMTQSHLKTGQAPLGPQTAHTGRHCALRSKNRTLAQV